MNGESFGYMNESIYLATFESLHYSSIFISYITFSWLLCP